MNNQQNNYIENTKINLENITYKTEELLELSSNRYKITLQVANRAKRKKYEDLDIIDDPVNKPIIRAILEMVDEITETEILFD